MLHFKKLKHSTRTALLFAFGILFIISLTVLLSWFFFLREINQLEVNSTYKAAQQTQEVITIKLDNMAKRSLDWASREDTYNLFMRSQNDPTNVLIDREILKTNDLDFVAFFSNTGLFINSIHIDRDTNTIHYITSKSLNESNDGSHSDILRLIQLFSSQQNFRSHNLTHSSVFLLNDNPIMITMTPIMAPKAGPILNPGYMVWLKYLNDFIPYNIFANSLNTVSILKIERLPSTIAAELRAKQATQSVINEHDIDIYIPLLNDFTNLSPAVLKVSAYREYFHNSRVALLWLSTSCLFCGFLICLFIFRDVRQDLIKRIQPLERGLRRLTQQTDSAHLLETTHEHDEIGMVTDIVNKLISERQDTNQALEQVENKFSAVFENASQPMMMIYKNRVLSANQATANLLGFDSISNLIGNHLDDMIVKQKQMMGGEFFSSNLKKGIYQFESELIGDYGWTVPCKLDITQIDHHGSLAMLVCITDISERKQHETKIKRLIFNDSLTGLFNRYALINRIQPVLKTLNSHSRFALIYINLDHFKTINDTFGHGIGDRVIKAVALKLSMECHLDSDTTLARLAGDEFIVFIPELKSLYQPIRLAHELRKLIQLPLNIDALTLEISSTISVIIGGKEYTTVEDLLRCADFAITKAKRKNKSIQVFSYKMYREALDNLTIQKDLPDAIKRGEVEAIFQPIVSCHTGEIMGFEALARWHHPELGAISPARFIPIAEELNLIIELGEQMLRKASRFIARINRMQQEIGHQSLSVHVNFSAHHFTSTTLIPRLKETLVQNNISPKDLVIEITESMLIDRPAESVKRMNQIKELGVGLALDDFGTGYSALNTLCQYPLDIVKLDRSFVLRLMEGQQGEILVRAIVNMARDLNLTMVAEGVETRAQMMKIRALGVNEIQGYYYYKPMPEKDIISLFEHNPATYLQ